MSRPSHRDGLSLSGQPEVKLDLTPTNTALEEEGLYEVVLSLTVTVTNGEETAFMVEVEQAGIFLIRNLDAAQLHHTLVRSARTFCSPMPVKP